MHTLETLINDLKQTNIEPRGTLMVHSSMKAIGDVNGRGETVIEALCQYMNDGLLLMPTHTWHEDNLKDGIYDVRSEKSCVGILTNLFLQHHDVIRSMHPTHSVGAYGKDNQAYADKDMDYIRKHGSLTPCPREGCFGSLYDAKGQILFLGAPLTTNTYLHGVEEIMDIPDRINPLAQRLILVDYDGKETILDDYHGHKSSRGDVSKNYGKIEPALIHKGYAKIYQIGDATCYVVQVKEMTDMVIEFLKKDPDIFADDRALPEIWYK